ncbi:uncharacterized protein LOC135398662 [Ornithodoros turicata]|uniref:uncharacterized protein LOC135398662 n=1 Tax=Ornithodoros turicata TaxID=34597 RepID=UPI003138A7FC
MRSQGVRRTQHEASRDDEVTWEPTLRSFWEIDNMGINPEPSASSKNPVVGELRGDCPQNDERYEVALPWKQDPANLLKDNFEVSMTRLKKLLIKLQRTDGLLLRYDSVIREYFNLGHAEVVDERVETQNPIYYMPHSAVIREDRVTTKVRVVFDASSHAPSCPSLNECLDKGVCLNPDILQLLLRFRSYKIALTADIEKAFLQVQIRPEDRDVFRYLWLEQPPSPEAIPDVSHAVQTLRMTRVPFGATSSPFLLSATIQHHLAGVAGEYKATAMKLKQSFYVDDLVTEQIQ